MAPQPQPQPDPSETVEIRGPVIRFRWHCPEGSGSVIFDLQDTTPGSTVGTVTVLGRDTTGAVRQDADGGARDVEIHAVGRWRTHPTRGRQFHADAIIRAEPRTKEGVVRYVREVLGITDSLARRLWTRWKERTPEVLRMQPEAVAASGLIELPQARYIAGQLRQAIRFQEVRLSLATLFSGRGFPRGVVEDCILRWRQNAAVVVRADPFLLLSLPGRPVGFARADALYLHLGGDPGRLKRQTLFIRHAIETNRDGHTWVRATQLARELADELDKRGGIRARAADAVKLGLRAGILAKQRDRHNILWISTAGGNSDEGRVAHATVQLLTSLAPI